MEIEVPGPNDGEDGDDSDDEDNDGDNDDNDNASTPDDGTCRCEENAGVCLCSPGDATSVGGCGCVHDGLKILSDNVHYLVLGKPFILDLEAEGGTTPYAWSLKDGSLPEGLTITEDGIVEGTPEVPGSFRVTIQVFDSSDPEGKTVSKRFTFLVVEDEKLAIMTDTLPDAQVGLFWAARVRGSGGTKPYIWALEVDKFPAWLSFDPDSGILSGTPVEAAIYDLTFRVKDGEENTDSKRLRLSVYPHDGLSVTTRVLPAAVYGKDYSAQLEVSGGIPPYVFTLRRGSSLPPGLALDTSGALAGTPSKKGTYSFVIDAMDGNNLQGSAAYTMTILGAEALAPSHDDFTVKEYESEKRILLEFSLSGDFDDAEILDVEALTSPDSTIAGSSSTVKREQNGYRINLTLHVAENALNNGDWKALLEQPTLDGITVKFQDASGEEMRFEKGLLVSELKKEEVPEPVSDKKDSGGGGCSAGWGELLSLLALIPIFAARKQ